MSAFKPRFKPTKRHFSSENSTSFALFCAIALLTGCHHKPKPNYAATAPSRIYIGNHDPKAWGERPAKTAARPSATASETSRKPIQNSDLHGKPTLVETGMASWYGPQYNHHKSSDGQVYDQNALTAAHRTLPLGSLARVTNLTTGESVTVRITDRGPFVRGRVLDLSEGAAKAIGVYRMGVARVKVEAFVPETASATGAWCVQTGAFQTASDANDLKAALLKRFGTSKVMQFQGPTGFWVRIDPPGRDHAHAAAILAWIGKPDDHADAYLVRID